VTAIIVLASAGIEILLHARSGVHNIAATRPHWGAALSFITLLKERFMAVHSGKIHSLESEDAKRGDTFSHFHEMCRLYHGAPG